MVQITAIAITRLATSNQTGAVPSEDAQYPARLSNVAIRAAPSGALGEASQALASTGAAYRAPPAMPRGVATSIVKIVAPAIAAIGNPANREALTLTLMGLLPPAHETSCHNRSPGERKRRPDVKP